MNWLKWHVGTVVHPRYAVIAKRAGTTRAVVIALWAGFLEMATQRGGRIDPDEDFETLSVHLDVDEDTIERVFGAMRIKGLINHDLRLTDWHKHAMDLRPPSSIWIDLRQQVFARDDYTCRYCGQRGGVLECDHVFPVSKGGGHELDNLVTACRPCNRAKRDKTPEEWARTCAPSA
jgi:hypothetical protein